MEDTILALKPKNTGKDYADFIETMHKIGLFNDFELSQIPFPVQYFADEFLKYISEHGISSLYNYSVILEDITSPTMHNDQIENVILSFVSKLDGVENLLIIDPYFFAGNLQQDHLRLLKELLKSISSNLKEICFITNDKTTSKQKVLDIVNDDINCICMESDIIHDRFWIDKDNYQGIVMGTSLNGIKKKIALIDSLSKDDAKTIVRQLINN